MEIKTDLSSDKLKKLSKDFLMKLPMFWDKGYRIVFIIIFLSCVGYAGYVWQQSTSGSAGWSLDKKEEFLKTQENGVVFKQADFNKAVKNVEDSKAKFDTDFKLKRNIFLP